jgi:hypothetical protein
VVRRGTGGAGMGGSGEAGTGGRRRGGDGHVRMRSGGEWGREERRKERKGERNACEAGKRKERSSLRISWEKYAVKLQYYIVIIKNIIQ